MTKKPKPQPIATILKIFLSIATLVAKFCEAYSDSDVIKSIIAVTASHKLMSDRDKGKCMHNFTLA
ncbi:MAG: hypothetical protein NWE99_10615 [Candidatus Bathyarchaeota archaeon]|nr:hypothetical protein [Candidatus Bathyarchaeota archaeon]